MLADVTNSDRARWALGALEPFTKQTRSDEAGEAIGDLMTNLMHLARLRGLDAHSLVERAARGFDEEVDEDDDGDTAEVVRLFHRLLPD